MTQHWDINDDGGLDVWDHEGTQLAENVEWSQVWYGYPDEMKAISRENMNGSAPSAYNQNVIMDYVFGDIERGDPNP